ncbi:MAG: hypothetical protein ABI045_04305 [Flavobacteriales bacterium]
MNKLKVETSIFIDHHQHLRNILIALQNGNRQHIQRLIDFIGDPSLKDIRLDGDWDHPYKENDEIKDLHQN